MRISGKVISLILMFVCLSAGVALLGAVALQDANRRMGALAERRSLLYGHSARYELTNIQRSTYMALTIAPAARPEAARRRDAAMRAVLDDLKAVKPVSPAAAAAYAASRVATQEVIDAVRKTVTVSKTDKGREALDFAMREMEPRYVKAVASYEPLIARLKEDNERDIAQAARHGAAVLMVLIGLSLLGIAITGVLALRLMRRQIVAPLEAVTAAMQRLAAGDLEAQVRHCERNDEVGDLMAAFGSFRQAAIDSRIAEAGARQLLQDAFDRAEAANQAKSDFLATISHEIRTPLNGVLGMAHAMSRDALPPAQRDRLRVIRRSGETLLNILNDVLDLSKIEAGKLELEQENFDLEQLIRGAAAAFGAVAAAKKLGFEIAIADRAKGVFVGDPTRIRRIVFNLLSNAVKFTEKGEVRLAVDRRGRMVSIRVADTGIGIASDKQSGIFQKFVQGDASISRRFGGSGLGLSICHGMVELMGGQIEVSSAAGKGSVFSVYLPLEPGSRTAGATTPIRGAPAARERRSALKVLAAEDNQVNQMVLKLLLAQVGIEAVIVDDGLGAVEAWEADEWDLILMDVQMPRLDGVAATQVIRGREQTMGRARTPIVALTANAMDHQVESYRAAGMDLIVAKPLQPDLLFAAIDQALQPPAAPAAARAASA